MSPVAASLALVDDLLRGRRRFAAGAATPWSRLALLITAAGALHGAALGSFSGRPLMSLCSAIKIPLLLAITTFLCLPAWFALHGLLGLRDDLGEALRAWCASQATFAVALVAASPLLLVAYASTSSYPAAVAWSGVCHLVALLAAQATLRRRYRPLERVSPRHRLSRRTFVLLYAFVAIEAAWILRPFVGAPTLAVRFLRPNAFTNAYIVISEDVVGGVLRGMRRP